MQESDNDVTKSLVTDAERATVGTMRSNKTRKEYGEVSFHSKLICTVPNAEDYSTYIIMHHDRK